MTWKKKSSTTVHEGKYVKVTLDEVEIPNGDVRRFTVVHKEPGVLIIPWDGENLTLVGQYRYPIDAFHWEFPQGHAEGHGLEEACRFELKEETGFTAGTVTPLGNFYLAAGHHTQKCHVFLATDLEQVGAEREASEEGMQTRTVSLAEFEQEVVEGKITDASTLASFALFTAQADKNF